MSNIENLLSQILSKKYGEDVRQSIHDAIQQCYTDAAEGITPVITTQPVGIGTAVIITVGANTTKFIIENGTATPEQVETYVNAWLDEHPEATTTVADKSITEAKLADDVLDKFSQLSQEIGDLEELETDAENLVEAVNNALGSGGGISQSAKDALINCFNHVAWTDGNGASYVETLRTALNSSTSANVISISAVYSGESVPVGNNLDTLRDNLVVTATYDDGTEIPVTGYKLSGSIVEGENTITVTYRKATTTFAVTGTASYTITYNLTGVSCDNKSTAVAENDFYTSNLTVLEDYSLSTITITMGGVDITESAYKDGVVLITNVTGDVVITAVATQLEEITMVKRTASSSVVYYSDPDATTEIEGLPYSSIMMSDKYTESDCTVFVKMKNDTEESVSVGTVCVGGIKNDIINTTKTAIIAVVNAENGVTLSTPLKAGEYVEFSYVLKAGQRFAVEYVEGITYSVKGTLDYTEPIAEISNTVIQAGTNTTYYSDGGTTELTTHNYDVRCFTSAFSEDTTIKITLCNETENAVANNVYGARYVGCMADGETNAGRGKVFYAEEYLPTSTTGSFAPGVSVSFEYTVKAGYCLCVGLWTKELTVYMETV